MRRKYCLLQNRTDDCSEVPTCGLTPFPCEMSLRVQGKCSLGTKEVVTRVHKQVSDSFACRDLGSEREQIGCTANNQAVVYLGVLVLRVSNSSPDTDPHPPFFAHTQDYLAMIYLLHDIDRLKHADIFVGTFSSNLGRFIATLRENKASFGADHKPWKYN